MGSGTGGGLGGMLGGAGSSGLGGLLGGGLGGLLGGLVSGGGLNSLLDKFGNIIDSWVGRGENQPIDPSQLGAALGPDTVDELAGDTGMEREEVFLHGNCPMPSINSRQTGGFLHPTRCPLAGCSECPS